MSAEDRVDTAYYDHFSAGGWDLSLMAESLKGLDAPAQATDTLRRTSDATLLVLGSATVRNIHNVANLDNILRPGQGHHDHAMIVDYSHHPMKQHRQEWDWLEPSTRTKEQQRYLPYPAFSFIQADIRDLPLPNESCDVVISDYTLNFLANTPDVVQTLGEAARVLKTKGLLLLAVAGHEAVDKSIALEDVVDTPPQLKQRSGHLVTSQLPLQIYEHAATSQGFALKAASHAGSSFLCAVLQKQL